MSKQKDEAIYRKGWNDGFAKGAAAARFQLEAENAELREEYDWMYEFQSRMAERINGNPDVHNLVDYVNKLEAENARLRSEFESIGTVAYLYGRNDLKAENKKLRDELDQWHRLTAGIELPEYPISQFVPKDLERENAKLRGLVRDLWLQLLNAYDRKEVDEFADRMRELGVEV